MYLPKALDPLMMEQEVVTPEELSAHFINYCEARGLDPFWFYNEHIVQQMETAKRIAQLRSLKAYQNVVDECQEAWERRQERLDIIGKVQGRF